jgi:hypothetical protein
MGDSEMHYEVLIEDSSGKVVLENLIPKIIGSSHTFNIHPYKGIGSIPKNLKPHSDPRKRILLDQLPRLIRGYGKTFAKYPDNYRAILIIVCDLDKACPVEFRRELLAIVNQCEPKPETYFCFAIEEGEAWLLGDLNAIKIAYPSAKDDILNSYINDSICGTWEKLADAIFPGGSQKLIKLGRDRIGYEKAEWAKRISPNLNVENNQSPSFCYFRNKLRSISDVEEL